MIKNHNVFMRLLPLLALLLPTIGWGQESNPAYTWVVSGATMEEAESICTGHGSGVVVEKLGPMSGKLGAGFALKCKFHKPYHLPAAKAETYREPSPELLEKCKKMLQDTGKLSVECRTMKNLPPKFLAQPNCMGCHEDAVLEENHSGGLPLVEHYP